MVELHSSLSTKSDLRPSKIIFNSVFEIFLFLSADENSNIDIDAI